MLHLDCYKGYIWIFPLFLSPDADFIIYCKKLNLHWSWVTLPLFLITLPPRHAAKEKRNCRAKTSACKRRWITTIHVCPILGPLSAWLCAKLTFILKSGFILRVGEHGAMPCRWLSAQKRAIASIWLKSCWEGRRLQHWGSWLGFFVLFFCNTSVLLVLLTMQRF